MIACTEWMHRAACSGQDDIEAFFPMDGDTAGRKAAKAICDGCPVQQACLDYANATGQDAGIWGGLTARERRNAKRTHARSELVRPVAVAHKQCRACLVIKPAGEFGTAKDRKDGLHASCKECVNEAARRRRAGVA